MPDEREILEGELPESLLNRAYWCGSEVAFEKPEAILFLDWCDQREVRVLGFDIWGPTQPGPTVISGDPGIEGDSVKCREIIASGNDPYLQRIYDEIRKLCGLEPVFAITFEELRNQGPA